MKAAHVLTMTQRHTALSPERRAAEAVEALLELERAVEKSFGPYARRRCVLRWGAESWTVDRFTAEIPHGAVNVEGLGLVWADDVPNARARLTAARGGA